VAIVNDYAERGLMIHRSHAELFDRLRDFVVAEDAGHVVGVAGLRVMWADLAEVYGLAVHPDARGRGIGRQLVEAVVDDARRLIVWRIFALTYERAFFERCGFAVVDRKLLPMKVWGECVRCAKHDCCDEIAMVRELAGVRVDTPRLPQPPAEAGYDVELPRVTPKTLRIDRAAGEDA
jgi:amino-acid N-acetyltransferase